MIEIGHGVRQRKDQLGMMFVMSCPFGGAVCSDVSIDPFDFGHLIVNRKLDLQLTSVGDRFRDKASLTPPLTPLTSDTLYLCVRALRFLVAQSHANSLSTEAARNHMAQQRGRNFTRHHTTNLSRFTLYFYLSPIART